MGKNTVKPGLTRKRRSRRQRSRRITVVSAVLTRFFTGRPLDGYRYSNATFWKPATRQIGIPYFVTWHWWVMAAGWQKAGLRLTAVAAAAMVVVGVVVR